MRYWDASALVPLIQRQSRSGDMERLLDRDPEVVTWWGTPVECWSALMRMVRDGSLTRGALVAAEQRLRMLSAAWDEVTPGESCRRTAERLLRVHPLRAADSLQLAAALVAADHDPSRFDLVCLDTRLADAARIEGFRVLD